MRISKVLLIAGLSSVIVVQTTGLAISQDEESFIRESFLTKKDKIVLSAAYPGLGQMTAGQQYRGVTFFVAETVSLLLAINAHEEYSTKNKVYTEDLKTYNALATSGRGSYAEAKEKYSKLKTTSQELDDLNMVRNGAIIAAGVVYAYNLFDAIFFNGSEIQSAKAGFNDNSVTLQSTLVNNRPGILLSRNF